MAIVGSLTLLALVPAVAAAAAEPRVDTGPSGLNVRAGPGTGYARIGGAARGAALKITCQVIGQRIWGVRDTNQWNRLATGGYVSAAYVSPGTAVLPVCAASVATAGFVASGPMVFGSRGAFLRQAAGPARRSFKEYGVPASVTIAQAILESGWGDSGLTRYDRNYFGIKCFGGPGPIAVGCHNYATHECDGNAGCYATSASFRVYRSTTDSFLDHGRFLTTNRRYRFAFAYSAAPDRFAAAIHKAGYATDPRYTQKLLHLMRTYNLYQYDR
jgi:flagellar protein FlgJ